MHTVSLGTTATLQVKEIGGSDKIRPYWPQYFTDQNDAIVFVVDAYAASHSVDCDELAKLLTVLPTEFSAPISIVSLLEHTS